VDDAAAIHARLAPADRAGITVGELRRLLAEVRGTAPIGARVAERTLPLSAARSLYVADRRWGAGRLRLTILSRRAGISLRIQPAVAPPPDPRAGRPTRARLTPPFRGRWWALEAPRPALGNHHADVPDQRHAYDFAVWRGRGTHRGAGARNHDYWAWDRPVLAPAGGTVVAAVDGLRDNRPQVQTDARHPAGNHVVIRLGRGEHALVAHLRSGTVRVRAGQRVARGQVLGRAGNSGNSSEPHVHLHVQDRPEIRPGAGVGIPLRGPLASVRTGDFLTG
jgi:murein DD-endopeptidase MepM/ murein hydrolase activator NlpD